MSAIARLLVFQPLLERANAVQELRKVAHDRGVARPGFIVVGREHAGEVRSPSFAPVVASLGPCFGLERKAIWPLPARSIEPTWRIRVPGSPAIRPPSRDTICASVSGPGMSFGWRLGLERLDHLVGDVDARVRIGGVLENDVVFLALRDLADDAVRAFDDLRQFFVAALVHVFAVFALLALEFPVQVVELALLVAALR